MAEIDLLRFGNGIEGEKNADGFYRRMMVKLEDCGVRLPSDAKFLEVGSGNGILLNFLKRKGLNIEGIDTELRGPGITKADIASLPYGDALFDCVISKQVFDNVVYPMQSPEVQKAMLREIGRVLKKGGIFYTAGEVLDEPLEGFQRLSDKSDDYFFAVYKKL